MTLFFYINLSKRTDRRHHCEEQFHRVGVSHFQRWKAIDGRTLISSTQHLHFQWKLLFQHFPLQCYQNNIIANALSHFSLWLQLLLKYPNEHWFVIVQDDVVLSLQFLSQISKIQQEWPTDAELIWLGMCLYAEPRFTQPLILEHEYDSTLFFQHMISHSIGFLHPLINPCSMAYLISRRGLGKIIEFTFRHGIRSPIDAHLNHYLQKKNIFYGCFPWIATTNPSLGSDVFECDDLSIHPLRKSGSSDSRSCCI